MTNSEITRRRCPAPSGTIRRRHSWVEVEEATEKPKKKTRRSKKKAAEPTQFIDGEKLSKNEIEFEEFISEHFDTEKWLKKNGLIL